jgi:hypothetical protein
VSDVETVAEAVFEAVADAMLDIVPLAEDDSENQLDHQDEAVEALSVVELKRVALG